MPVLKFRVYWEEDDSVYRDIAIKPQQNFMQFHESILQAYLFDQKHQAVFFRSNDNWERGREIIQEKDEQPRKVEPLMMAETSLADAVRTPSQKFIYVYDFVKHWTFHIELIGISKEENIKLDYPACVRKEGLAPSQYGTKGAVNEKLVEIEEKYDLNSEDIDGEGYGEEGEEAGPEEDSGQNEF